MIFIYLVGLKLPSNFIYLIMIIKINSITDVLIINSLFGSLIHNLFSVLQ